MKQGARSKDKEHFKVRNILVLQEVAATYPPARIYRMDSSTISREHAVLALATNANSEQRHCPALIT